MRPTDPAHEAYYRLLEAQQRIIPQEEIEQRMRDDAANTLRNRIRRKLPKVY